MPNKEPKYTQGRATAATMLGGYHAAFAGKPGKKLRAFGNSAGGTIAGGALGAAAGGLAGSALSRGNPIATAAGLNAGSLAGSIKGANMGFHRNNRKGYYKKQSPDDFKKNYGGVSAFGIEH